MRRRAASPAGGRTDAVGLELRASRSCRCSRKAAIVTIEATLLGFVIAAILGLVFAILRMLGPAIAAPVTLAHRARALDAAPHPDLLSLFRPAEIRRDASTPSPPACSRSASTTRPTARRSTAPASTTSRAASGRPRSRSTSRPFTTFTDIILPQAIPPIVPALGNYLVALFKETPLLSAIAVLELMQTAKIIGSESFRYVEPITLVGAALPHHEPRLRRRHPLARAGRSSRRTRTMTSSDAAADGPVRRASPSATATSP